MTGGLVVSAAVTVRLPWAAAIRAGQKTVENRARPIGEKHIGTRIGIHAAATWSKEGGEDPRIRSWWWGPSWDRRMPLDATNFSRMFRKVVSVVRVDSCHQATDGCCTPWGDRFYIDPAKAAWHIVFADVVPLADPVGPVKGSLGFPWTLPPDAAEQVTERYLDAP